MRGLGRKVHCDQKGSLQKVSQRIRCCTFLMDQTASVAQVCSANQNVAQHHGKGLRARFQRLLRL